VPGEGVSAAEPVDAGDLADGLGGAQAGDAVDGAQVRCAVGGALVELAFEVVDGQGELADAADQLDSVSVIVGVPAPPTLRAGSSRRLEPV